jgi:hypothetical protein
MPQLPFEVKVLLTSARELLTNTSAPDREQALKEWLAALERYMPANDPFASAYRTLDKLRAIRERGR